MKLLGAVEKPFYRAVNPLVEWLIRAGVRPNTITTIGTGLVLVSAVAYGMGHIRIGGALLLLSGVADTLDAQEQHQGVDRRIAGPDAFRPLEDAAASAKGTERDQINRELDPTRGLHGDVRIFQAGAWP